MTEAESLPVARRLLDGAHGQPAAIDSASVRGAAVSTIREQLAESSDLRVAVSVAQKMLTAYGTVDSADIFAYAQAHGALAESLRIILRALGAEHANSVPANELRERCPAAHRDDPTPCDGPPVVTVLDAHNAGADGCEHHGARLLASLEGGRVYALPDAPEGAAIRVFKAVATIRPFAWTERGEGK